MSVDWNDLKVFLAVARAGSIRGASENLKVAHSTVSRRMDALEFALKTRLFDRTPDGLLITPSGEELVVSAQKIEETMHAAERSVAGRDSELSGDVRFTLPLPMAVCVLTDDLTRFVKQNPLVNLTLELTEDLLDLSKREADIAMRFTSQGNSPPNYLVGRNLATQASCAYASADYIDAHVFSGVNRNAKWLGWDDVVEYPKWVHSAGLEPMPVMGSFDDVFVQMAFAKRGLGMAYLPCMMGDLEPDLRRVPSARAVPHTSLWVLTHPDLRDSVRLRRFREYLYDAVSDKLDLIEGRGA
ncbi:LysR family transcriptional regulator [uncultured Roseibium sp.]|uniref:LysR family transcriptional regulator n=1 Tax=uncultured Roseibium sp. TaxID=1936171 RepID=UPI002611EA2C|nr:LysR family transcriptional regulator [uncultured Roseibium sp.]